MGRPRKNPEPEKTPVDLVRDELRKMPIADFLDLVAETMQRVNIGGTLAADESELIRDYAIVSHVQDLIRFLAKRQDEDFLNVRKIKGEDFAAGVSPHRKRSDKDSNPFAEMFG